MDVSRYDFGCQKALHQGLQYAKSLGATVLEVESVALALLRGDFSPGKTVDRDGLRKHLERHLALRPRVFGAGRIQFGARLDAALDMAEAAAGRDLVNEKILWESLCKQSTVIQLYLGRGDFFEETKIPGDSVKKQIFDDFKSKKEGVKDPPSVKGDAGREKTSEHYDHFLKKYTLDLTARAQRGELDPVVGREVEVRRVLEILGRKKKNNPILLGDPGVGKSAIAEALALRIVSGNVPESMNNKRVLSLDLGAILAGAKYRGEFEDRFRKLLAALHDLKGEIVLFIDEIHMIIGAGNQEGGADVANLMKPALARGEVQCLGATTIDEYRRHIERDAALERRFQPINVGEPNRDQAIEILRGLRASYEVHHGVQIEDSALIAAVDLSVRYLPARKLPDKAIDLIDEAASRLRLSVETVPSTLEEMRSEIDRIEIEQRALIANGLNLKSDVEHRLRKIKAEYAMVDRVWHEHQNNLDRLRQLEIKRQEAESLFETAKSQGDFTFAARIQYDEIPRIGKGILVCKEILSEQQKTYSFLRQVVTSTDIAEVVSVWTGIPAGRLLEGEAKKLLGIEGRLASRVFGQEEALERIARAVRRSRAGLNDPARPIGVFLFLGPTGVGKTETARALARELFDDDSKLIRIDMSEYMEIHSVARLVGAPPGYVGYDDSSGITELIRRSPYSVVLFDEIEKAHPRVLDVLLALLEDGRLTDGHGRTADFRHALIILTSNINLDIEFDPSSASDGVLRSALAQKIRPELVNRISDVVVYRSLGRRHLDMLVSRLLDELNRRLSERQLRITLADRLRRSLVSSVEDSPFGGRALRRIFEDRIVDEIADRVLMAGNLCQGAWRLDVDDEGAIKWSPECRQGYYLLPPAS